MASATAPPTPVSISSNTKVGAEPRSASTTLSASRKRASSPPEATFISGPGLVPGLVCTQNSTRSMPFGPGAAASVSISVENFARSSFSGLSSPLTALSSAVADLARAVERLVGGRAIGGFGLARRRLQLLEPVLAGIDQRDVGGIFRAPAPPGHRPACRICAPRRAAQTAAPRCVRARRDRSRRCDQRRARGAVGFLQRVDARHRSP